MFNLMENYKGDGHEHTHLYSRGTRSDDPYISQTSCIELLSCKFYQVNINLRINVHVPRPIWLIAQLNVSTCDLHR